MFRLKRLLQVFICALSVWVFASSCSVMMHTNKSSSEARGTVGNGELSNSWLMPYSGPNYKYFSPMSYYVLGNAFTHEKMHHTLLGAFKTCETTCPGYRFRLMECANKKGGKMLIHRTHQTGLSVDIMTPLKKGNKQYRRTDGLGLWHYLLNYDENGYWNKNVQIDFEILARLVLAIDDSAKENGLKLTKVILKINLKDDLFATPSGKEIKARGIYFAKVLPTTIDNLHDDHIHLDFTEQ